MMLSGQPDGDAFRQRSSSGIPTAATVAAVNVGWIMITLAVFCLLWFIAALRRAVSMVDGQGILTGIIGIGGGIYAALAFASVALELGIRTMSDDTYQHRVYPKLNAGDVSWVMHATGAVGLGAMIIAASLAPWRSGRAGPGRSAPWSAYPGASPRSRFPQFLFLLWILIVSIVIMQSHAGRRVGEPAALGEPRLPQQLCLRREVERGLEPSLFQLLDLVATDQHQRRHDPESGDDRTRCERAVETVDGAAAESNRARAHRSSATWRS